jgi:hypothetical protein
LLSLELFKLGLLVVVYLSQLAFQNLNLSQQFGYVTAGRQTGSAAPAAAESEELLGGGRLGE